MLKVNFKEGKFSIGATTIAVLCTAGIIITLMFTGHQQQAVNLFKLIITTWGKYKGLH